MTSDLVKKGVCMWQLELRCHKLKDSRGQEGAWDRSFFPAFRGGMALMTPWFKTWPLELERIHVCCHVFCGPLLGQLREKCSRGIWCQCSPLRACNICNLSAWKRSRGGRRGQRAQGLITRRGSFPPLGAQPPLSPPTSGDPPCHSQPYSLPC